MRLSKSFLLWRVRPRASVVPLHLVFRIIIYQCYGLLVKEMGWIPNLESTFRIRSRPV